MQCLAFMFIIITASCLQLRACFAVNFIVQAKVKLKTEYFFLSIILASEFLMLQSIGRKQNFGHSGWAWPGCLCAACVIIRSKEASKCVEHYL